MSHSFPADTRVGLLSDSHGNDAATRQAVNLLAQEHRADVLIHLGDVETVEVIDALAGHPAHVVFGNCDWNWQSLAEYAETVGLVVDHPCGQVSIGDKRICFAHGDNPHDLNMALAEKIEYFCHGHTHLWCDQRQGRTRIINPGALFRATEYSVALLVPESDELTYISVPRS